MKKERESKKPEAKDEPVKGETEEERLAREDAEYRRKIEE